VDTPAGGGQAAPAGAIVLMDMRACAMGGRMMRREPQHGGREDASTIIINAALYSAVQYIYYTSKGKGTRHGNTTPLALIGYRPSYPYWCRLPCNSAKHRRDQFGWESRDYDYRTGTETAVQYSIVQAPHARNNTAMCRVHVSVFHSSWPPGVFYTCFYNHAHRLRLEKL
jgi:hypothetical protein